MATGPRASVSPSGAPHRFSTLPRPAQLQIALIGPLLVGAVSGFLLDISAAGFWAVQGLGAAGGLGGGMEHASARAGARRGLLAGLIFGVGLIGAHAISNRHALASIPHPSALLLPVTALGGCGLGCLGGLTRAGASRRSIDP